MRIRATGSAMKRGGGGAGGCDVDCVKALIKMGREHAGEETGSREGTTAVQQEAWYLHQKRAESLQVQAAPTWTLQKA